jgi:hypothetical protein
VRWTGANGEAVEVIRVRGKDDITRNFYRLRRGGLWIADYATLDELAQHIDLATLTEVE